MAEALEKKNKAALVLRGLGALAFGAALTAAFILWMDGQAGVEVQPGPRTAAVDYPASGQDLAALAEDLMADEDLARVTQEPEDLAALETAGGEAP